MPNDLLENDATAVYDEPFESLGFRFSTAYYVPSTTSIHVELKNGMKIDIPRDRSKIFTNATDSELSEVEVYESSIYFPRIDEGFSLEPLAFGDFGNVPWDSEFLAAFKQRAQSQLSAA